MTEVREMMEEAVALLTPLMADTFEETAQELENLAYSDGFDLSGVGGLTALGWQHKYQAMYMRNLAKNIRERIEGTKAEQQEEK
jgi:hypothetical protein